MAEIQEFVTPAFLRNYSVEEVHARILARIPDEIDKTEGGFVWDLTYPHAVEIAQLVEFSLAEAVKNLFPAWAYDEMLDAHGQTRGIARRAAIAARGAVEISGRAGAEIPAGTIVTTTPDGDGAAIAFATAAAATIGAAGAVAVEIAAVEPGAAGNVAAGRVNRFEGDAPDGVTGVVNPAATGGGVDVEGEESYRQRLVDYDQSQGESFVGNVADYKRWALEVPGVGGARVLGARDDTGLVTIVITGADGLPASDELRAQVRDAILRPDDELMRKAPPNASVRVITPQTVAIEVRAALALDETATIAGVKGAFLAALRRYYDENDEGLVRYNRVAQILMSAPGVVDFSALTLNGGVANIAVGEDEMPETNDGQVVFTA